MEITKKITTPTAAAKSALTIPRAPLIFCRDDTITAMHKKSTTQARKRVIGPARVSEKVTPSGVRIGSAFVTGLDTFRARFRQEQRQQRQLYHPQSNFQIVRDHRLVVFREEGVHQSGPHPHTRRTAQ